MNTRFWIFIHSTAPSARRALAWQLRTGREGSVMMEHGPQAGRRLERRAGLADPQDGCVAAAVQALPWGCQCPFPVSRSEAIPRGDYFSVVRARVGCEKSPHHLGMILPHLLSAQPPYSLPTQLAHLASLLCPLAACEASTGLSWGPTEPAAGIEARSQEEGVVAAWSRHRWCGRERL